MKVNFEMLHFLSECWQLIEKPGKRKIVLITFITTSLNVLDLVAVSLIGVVGALAFRGIQNQEAGDRTNRVLQILNLESLKLSEQIMVIGVIAFLLLVLKSVLVYLATQRIFLFMSYQSAYLSEKLSQVILKRSVHEVQSKSSQEYVFHLTVGTNNLMMGGIGTAFSILADLALFVFLITLLLIVDFKSAVISAAIFIFVGILLHRMMQNRAIRLGRESKNLSVGNNERIQELTSSFREIIVRNSGPKYAKQILSGRIQLANVSARLKMMPLFSKYFMEITVFALFLSIALIQFIINDSSRAVGNLALFLAASTRISPAVLRVQQGSVQIKSAMGGGESTLDFIKSGKQVDLETNIRGTDVLSESRIFSPHIEFKSVMFEYSQENKMKIVDLNFTIDPYEFVALVGPSGAGKSTFVDLLFGLLLPKRGEILISGIPSRDALESWPGNFGYVPQNVMVHKGTIMSNLLLGLDRNPETEKQAIKLLKMVNMYETIMDLEGGLDALIDERGGNLSGGQRQRLGIARALMTNPKILVLDESTSMLDATSENIITNAIQELRDKVTLIVIAHRLSTVKSAKKLLYIEDGRILAEGNFETLRNQVIEFDNQAKLMGL
jgi:ABC-type multidrug transport system fused ATPase/permease subunit